jgi:hypothetical protein
MAAILLMSCRRSERRGLGNDGRCHFRHFGAVAIKSNPKLLPATGSALSSTRFHFIRASSASAAMKPNGIQFGPVMIRSKSAFASAVRPL